MQGAQFTIYEGSPKHMRQNLLWESKRTFKLLNYLLQNGIVQVLCSDSSHTYIFQYICGRPFLEWPAVAVPYSIVSLRRLDIFCPPG